MTLSQALWMLAFHFSVPVALLLLGWTLYYDFTRTQILPGITQRAKLRLLNLIMNAFLKLVSLLPQTLASLSMGLPGRPRPRLGAPEGPKGQFAAFVGNPEGFCRLHGTHLPFTTFSLSSGCVPAMLPSPPPARNPTHACLPPSLLGVPLQQPPWGAPLGRASWVSRGLGSVQSPEGDRPPTNPWTAAWRRFPHAPFPWHWASLRLFPTEAVPCWIGACGLLSQWSNNRPGVSQQMAFTGNCSQGHGDQYL